MQAVKAARNIMRSANFELSKGGKIATPLVQFDHRLCKRDKLSKLSKHAAPPYS